MKFVSTNLILGVCGVLLLGACSIFGSKKTAPPAPIAAKSADPQAIESCFSAREFITTLEYLRADKSLGGNDPNARKIADEVSKGCNGAARRFVNTVELLSKAEIGQATAIKTGIEVSQKTDGVATAFFSIFQKCYLPGFLDLDLNFCLKKARRWSVEFGAEASHAEKDYSNLIKYCIHDTGLELSKAKCAEFADEFVQIGEIYRREIFPDFVYLFEYLRERQEQKPNVQAALQLTQRILKSGDGSAENFVKAYEYALSSDGLKLPATDALKFGLQIAGRTQPEKKSTKETLKQ